jgi:putative membrane protein
LNSDGFFMREARSVSVIDKSRERPAGEQLPAPVEKLPANSAVDWFARLLKGALVGIGAILPGLSGGVLAVVFGLYEPLLRFLANPQVRFLRNVRYFLPVGIGGFLGVFIFSAVVDFAFDSYAAQFIWLFVGFIAGTFPSLLKKSAEQGRRSWHWFVLLGMSVATFYAMHWMETISNVTVSPNMGIWLVSGILMALGLVVPGLSPSNFLIYLGLYQPMASGIRQLDFAVIIPIIVGMVICILVFAKLVSWLFQRAHALMYHLILGIVVGSTLAIIPSGVAGWGAVASAILFVLGAAGSFALSKIDEKYPHESIF